MQVAKTNHFNCFMIQAFCLRNLAAQKTLVFFICCTPGDLSYDNWRFPFIPEIFYQRYGDFSSLTPQTSDSARSVFFECFGVPKLGVLGRLGHFHRAFLRLKIAFRQELPCGLCRRPWERNSNWTVPHRLRRWMRQTPNRRCRRWAMR